VDTSVVTTSDIGTEPRRFDRVRRQEELEWKGAQMKILLVDDHGLFLEGLHNLLSAGG
jgi:hypothetical protein